MSVIDFFSNAASGGLLGLVGTLSSKAFNYVDRKQDMEAKVAEYKHELALIDKQAALKIIETENELAIAKVAAENQLRVSSYGLNFESTNGSAKVTDLLRLVRPVLTISLVLLTAVLWCTSEDKTIDQQIVDMILFCTASAVTWWYGDRASFMSKGKK